ncbi:MAG: sialate O-acetylesterase [Oscillospiraceae bacterium]|jgi:hypothetical protein|nr:sialate O-acetylesterase [Oscillospiraceae bacterium]
MQNEFSGPYDIIVQAGQSNSEGCGLGEAAEPYAPDERILYLTSHLVLAPAAERERDGQNVSDFSLFFAREYVRAGRLAPGRRMLILRTAVGGTGFLDKRWGKQDDLFLNMLSMIRHAKGLHPESRFVAFLWHQGETDATLKATCEGHRQNLAGLLDAVRTETEAPCLPFVAGDFVQEWKGQNLAVCEPVIAAIRQVCQDKNGRFVETGDLFSNNQQIKNGDTIHFSTASLETLGKRCYEAIFGK